MHGKSARCGGQDWSLWPVWPKLVGTATRVFRGVLRYIAVRAGTGEADVGWRGLAAEVGVVCDRDDRRRWRCRSRTLARRRSRPRSPSPTRTIRSSTPSARWCAPPMKTCRRRWPATGPEHRLTANAGVQSLSTTIREIGSTTPPGAPASYFTQSGDNTPRGFGATLTQNLLNGFQTANRTRQAESQVRAARETLRTTEQTVLLNAATAYMNLLRDTAILDLQRSNLEVLQEQLRQTKTAARIRQRHGDRRFAVRSPPFGRAHAVVRRRGQLRDLAGGVPAGDRLRGRQAAARHFGRSVFAATRCRPRSPRGPRNIPRSRRRNTTSTSRSTRSRSRKARSIRPCPCTAACRRTTSRAERAGVVLGVGRHPALGPDLSGRRRIFRDPAGQGDARASGSSISTLARDQARVGVSQAWAQLDAVEEAASIGHQAR